MKTILLILFSFLLSMNSFASNREIVVLTSIQNPRNKPFWRSKSYDISKDIESQYREAFKNSGYNVVFNHNTDEETLEHYLRSPATLALFWVSHAADESVVNGLSFSSIIQDVKGNNVKNIFQKINPNVKFLSIVGCKARSILEEFKSKGYFHSDLTVHTFDKKITLNNGIDQSLRAAAKVIDADPKSFRDQHDNFSDHSSFRNTIVAKESYDEIIDDKDEEGIKISIINTNPDFLAKLSVNDQFIGLLKKGNHLQEFIIPKTLITKRTKLKVDFDISHLRNPYILMPLEVENNDQFIKTDYLKDKNGLPYGRDSNFYYIYFAQ